MTGTGPLEHGVLDFVRFRPRTGEREPIGSAERARPAIWNMATWGGKKVGVFGLWATYPAEAVDGVLVSDRLFGFLNLEDRPPEGAVYPPARQAWATRDAAARRRRGRRDRARALPALAHRRRLRRARRDAEGRCPALRRSGVGAAAHPDRDPRLRRALPRVRRRVASRSRDPLSAGHRQHRPPVRSLRGAAPARSVGRGFRALPRGARALLPMARRSPRPLPRDGGARRRRSLLRFRSRLPVAGGPTDHALELRRLDRRQVASQRGHLSALGSRGRRDDRRSRPGADFARSGSRAAYARCARRCLPSPACRPARA